jgi:hypothetical protein
MFADAIHSEATAEASHGIDPTPALWPNKIKSQALE